MSNLWTYHIGDLESYSNKLFLHEQPTLHHLCLEFLQILQCDLHFLVVLTKTRQKPFNAEVHSTCE